MKKGKNYTQTSTVNNDKHCSRSLVMCIITIKRGYTVPELKYIFLKKPRINDEKKLVYRLLHITINYLLE